MSDTNIEDVKEHEFADNSVENQIDKSVEEPKDSDRNEENAMPSLRQEEEQIKKKYGGMLPKKPPLISKDHERAFFDSADWALGKQGAKGPKGPLEALRPKLQPTPHHQSRSRRSAYAPADEDGVDGGENNTSSEAQSCESDVGNTNNPVSEEQKSHG